MKKINRSTKIFALMAIDTIAYILAFLLSSFIVRTSRYHSELTAIVLICYALLMFFLLVFHYYSANLNAFSLEIIFSILKAELIPFLVGFAISLFKKSRSDAELVVLLFTYFSAFSLGIRFIFRWFRLDRGKKVSSRGPVSLVYGAGDLGKSLARQFFGGKLNYDIIGFVDDDESLEKNEIFGIPVLGNVDDIDKIIKKKEIETLIIAITDLPKEKLYKAVDAAKDNKCDIKIIPTLYEIQNGVKELNLRNLDYPDLLGRSLIEIDKAPIESMVKDKVVLVTGACGSIGSEICKQLVGFGVKRLVMLDIDESALHDQGLRLTGYKEEINDKIIPILCDVKNKNKVDRIFQQYKPEIVYHAAAYKHVPMGEREPDEIIKTNVCGSYNIFLSSKGHGVKKVVVISTDKAVNPTNVMGASKRMVELVATMVNSKETEIVAVRFGNVLGSRGSMLPLFVEQIHAGVPITVTHKDIIRYFMAIPEAVGLVLKAGAMAKGGEVMVLDMGQPVKIYDFAQRLIRYYGDEERNKIIVTGLRPGEKLYEELLAKEDTTIKTNDKLVFKAKLNDHKLNEEEFLSFYGAIDDYSDEELEEKLKAFVPEFNCQNSKVLLQD